MNTTVTRLSAFLLAALLLCMTAFSVFAEGGNSDGSGDGGGRETPLTLASSSVVNGAENVDPNVHIVLTFTKNVVHFNVKENNMKCFSVKDVKGNAVPITVEMGDDQIDPDIKRIVTIVPRAPYKTGETYILKISRELTAKNEENKLDTDVYLSFTIREAASTTKQSYNAPVSPNATTTTTKKAAETTTKRVTTTRTPITAATRAQSTAAATTAKAAQTTKAASAHTTIVSNGTPRAPSSTVTQTVTATTIRTTVQTTVDSENTGTQTEPVTIEETTAVTVTVSEAQTDAKADAQTEAKAQTQGEPSQETGTHKSPLLFIGIFIALAAAAGAVIGIIHTKKKKG